jgi:hypothetical protein
MPGGQPSITQPMAGPWDSPKLVTVKRCPKVLPLMPGIISQDLGATHLVQARRGTTGCSANSSGACSDLPAGRGVDGREHRLSRSGFWRYPGPRGLPGLAPAGDFLFLSRQEKEAKEGEPGASSLRYAQGTLRCSDRAGDPQTRPAGSNMRISFSARSCATRLRTRRWDPKTNSTRTRHGASLWGSAAGSLALVSVPRSAAAGGSRDAHV